MMGFTKLDSGIVNSSIMLLDPIAFKVWIALLAKCECDGIARITAPGIAGCCFISIEQAVESLKILESPDEYSKSLNDEGRRIARVDGGYRIINYLKYRERTLSTSPDAVRVRKSREEKKLLEQSRTSTNNYEQLRTDSNNDEHIRTSANSSASAYSSNSELELELNAINDEPKRARKKQEPPTQKEFTAYCKENGFSSIAERAFKYYAEASWKDSTGKPVLSWKSKLQAVWFKDENRDTAKIATEGTKQQNYKGLYDK